MANQIDMNALAQALAAALGPALENVANATAAATAAATATTEAVGGARPDPATSRTEITQPTRIFLETARDATAQQEVFQGRRQVTCWGCGEQGHALDQVHSQPVPPARQEPQTAQTPLQIPTSEPANASPYASTMDVDSPTLTSFGLGVSNSVSSEEEDAGTRENPIEIGTTPTKTSTPPTTRRYPLRNRVPTNRYGRTTRRYPLRNRVPTNRYGRKTKGDP